MTDRQLRYGRVVTTKLSFDRAAARARELLKNEGFGILSEIDVAKTLKEKRGVEFQPYLILGACNPDLAHKALLAEEQLGLLLPCNVVVTVQGGRTKVSAVDAGAMLSVVGNPELAAIAAEVNTRLQKVLAAIAAE
jgi:uncharacterized protein (DUF302 family)